AWGLIDHTISRHNGSSITFDHQAYVGGHELAVTNSVFDGRNGISDSGIKLEHTDNTYVANNEIMFTRHGIDCGTNASSPTPNHNVLIEGNRIHDQQDLLNSGWNPGISLNWVDAKYTIRNNLFYRNPTNSFTSSINIFSNSSTEIVKNVRIYNNIF